MNAQKASHARVAPIGRALAVIAALTLLAVLIKPVRNALGLWRWANMGRAVLDSRNVTGSNRGNWTDVIFLHHSVGTNLIEQGGVREKLTAAGFDFWDHGYMWQRLGRPDGARTNYSYNIPDDNTDPDGFAAIFAQPISSLPVNALSGLMQHQVIVFKSCFPVSDITSDEQLETYKSYYIGVRSTMDKHRDKVFIVVTPPPLNPAETGAPAAVRARAFADWLKSDDYLGGRQNVFTFDLFDQLAENNPAAPDHNMLRAAYREGDDSHPNRRANELIGPSFADFIVQAVQQYRAISASVPSGQ